MPSKKLMSETVYKCIPIIKEAAPKRIETTQKKKSTNKQNEGE